MTSTHDQAAADEFDAWAAKGRGEGMENGHLPVTLPVLEKLELGPTSRVLDVGCGAGWLVRLCLERGAGQAAGVDISPGMIERAAQGPGEFKVASGETLPFADGRFSHVLTVESLYYYADPAAALGEFLRVSAPGGQLAVVIELYAESPAGQAWKDALEVNVHNWSQGKWAEVTSGAGWQDVRTHRIPRPGPVPIEADFRPGPYWPNYAALKGYHQMGALVILGQKA
ncbi:MAG: SAM-dependent methyltransferase [Cognaticolwellia sp.]|jgi:SAM-dependent methyltransferase